MAPTHGDEEIEGRYKERKTYKERSYAYSPVPASGGSTAVHDSTTLGKQSGKNGARQTRLLGSNGVRVECPVNKMTEKGSTRLQYIAAGAGKSQPSFSRLSPLAGAVSHATRFPPATADPRLPLRIGLASYAGNFHRFNASSTGSGHATFFRRCCRLVSRQIQFIRLTEFKVETETS